MTRDIAPTGDIAPMADIAPRILRTPRAAGAAGILFAVLYAGIVVLLHSAVPENMRGAGSWLSQADRRREAQAALALAPFCGIFFLWFMGAVRSRVSEAEDKFFSTVFLGSGLLFVAMLFAFSAVAGGLIEVAGLYHAHPPLSVWRLGTATTLNLASIYAVRMEAVFMLASSTIALRLRIHSRLVAGVGYLAGLLLLFGTNAIPWIQLVFPFWVFLVGVNIVILTYREARPASATPK